MGIIGRNEPCYCGSGKKYKKCCLKTDEDKLHKGIVPRPTGESFEIAKTTHNLAFGIKELALAQIEQIIIWLSRKHIQPAHIQVNSKDLYELATTDDMVEHYLTINREVLMAQGRPNILLELNNLRERAKKYPSLTKNERTVIRTIANSSLGEFMLLGDANTADYSAMRVLNEFCYQAIKEGIPDDQSIIAATLYVDSDGDQEKLINWELIFSDDDDETPLDEIWIDWQALDTLTDEYHKFAHSLHGLEEESKNDLATAMYQEKTLPSKSKKHFSYRGLVMTYTGILEKELKKLIELEENRSMTDLTLKKINDYILKNPLPHLDQVPNLYHRLEEIRQIRNSAAHGEDVSYDDFEKVKDFLIEEQVLEFISWAKVEYEEDDEVVTLDSLF